ncbi:hypothetical protein PR048_014460 [Dryococelus australis]|uniref:Uncharacterized protein n=1 Tax=Dryococelus australis TaxID=614101 RepID=A0ABQ9HEA9_9NEOP|nr:hypothetical protein PR048_014460 [Dryococelus australis]
MQVRGSREFPEKAGRQAALSSTIPTCENPGVNPPGIVPGSTWWEASALATAPPLPHLRDELWNGIFFFAAVLAFVSGWLNGRDSRVVQSGKKLRLSYHFVGLVASGGEEVVEGPHPCRGRKVKTARGEGCYRPQSALDAP